MSLMRDRAPWMVGVVGVLLLLGGGCESSEESGVESQQTTAEIVTQGSVSAIDLTPMETDGDGRLWIADDNGKNWSIRVPTGFAPPSPTSRDVLVSLKLGERVEVFGRMDSDGTLGLAKSVHYLKRLEH